MRQSPVPQGAIVNHSLANKLWRDQNLIWKATKMPLQMLFKICLAMMLHELAYCPGMHYVGMYSSYVIWLLKWLALLAGRIVSKAKDQDDKKELHLLANSRARRFRYVKWHRGHSSLASQTLYPTSERKGSGHTQLVPSSQLFPYTIITSWSVNLLTRQNKLSMAVSPDPLLPLVG